MGLFNRRSAVKADPDQLKRWRGRAAELNDAGPMPWQIVLEALKTTADPRPGHGLDYLALVMAPLGLRGLDDPLATSIFHGQRYGRPVLMNQGDQGSGQRGAIVTWVGVATPALSVTASDGRLTVADTAPLPIVEAVRALSMQPTLWSKVHLIGGAEGLVVKRPIHTAMHPQGWVYDLWLAEHVAHLAGYSTLPAPDPTATLLPYQRDHTPSW